MRETEVLIGHEARKRGMNKWGREIVWVRRMNGIGYKLTWSLVFMKYHYARYMNR